VQGKHRFLLNLRLDINFLYDDFFWQLPFVFEFLLFIVVEENEDHVLREVVEYPVEPLPHDCVVLALAATVGGLEVVDVINYRKVASVAQEEVKDRHQMLLHSLGF
jgi:hypothetical protein